MRRSERGFALIVALLSTSLLTTLGGALLLLTMTEMQVAANFRDGVEAFYAAEGALARVLPELAATSDWDAVLAGTVTSSLVDGPPGGTRDLGAGTQLDLVEVTNQLRCGRPEGCTAPQMDAATDERPWGHNNPRWQLFAWGDARSLLSDAGRRSPLYLVVWVGDDPFEVDADPRHDGALPSTPGHGMLALRAHAYGPGGTGRAVEATVVREAGVVRIRTWREVR